MAKPFEKSLIIVLSGLSFFAGMGLFGQSHAQRVVPLPPPPPIIWPDERPADPARWTQEDVTPEQRYDTARKESVAAHQIAKDYCLSLPKADQAVCLAQARLEYEREMSEIKMRFGVTP
ncbi:hypothetical protein [Zwartia vadi]|uniref:hypothetical protein n=1 Tax=Zwartia vadi TaxID=3058168 RepID=UPI0025B5EAEC|nr:hypothetical protein [Zwartia vadi]MDN3986510.1 hypothetical protein [Zwartia vadi]